MRAILAPILILSLSALFLNFYSRLNHILPYKEASIELVSFDSSRPSHVTKEYIKQEIDSIFKCNYVLTYKDLGDEYNGVSYIMLKLITLDCNLTLEEFALTLTHELVHITYFTSNERFTSFKAFQILYESENNYFKNIALAYANLDFNGQMPKEYSCAGYIEEYLGKQSLAFPS